MKRQPVNQGESVTQKQIAREFGVTRQLVGMALNGHPGVAEETRRRIREKAVELGYNDKSNRSARHLADLRHGRRGQSGIVAVLLPSADAFPGSTSFALPFYVELMAGIQAEADDRGLAVLTCNQTRGNLVGLLDEHQVDGVLMLSPWTGDSDIRRDLRVPCFTVSISGLGPPCLIPDDADGIRVMVNHLVALGHRSIGYMGLTEGCPEGALRARSFRDSMAAAGAAPRHDWMRTDIYSFNRAAEEMELLLQRAPELTAVVCYNDVFAMRIVQALQSRGIRVPEDISVTGFDDVTTGYFFQPAITSVWYDRVLMGRRAVEHIYDPKPKLAGSPEVFPVSAAIRQSTAVPHRN